MLACQIWRTYHPALEEVLLGDLELEPLGEVHEES